jgi:hypothetical protein
MTTPKEMMDLYKKQQKEKIERRKEKIKQLKEQRKKKIQNLKAMSKAMTKGLLKGSIGGKGKPALLKRYDRRIKVKRSDAPNRIW